LRVAFQSRQLSLDRPSAGDTVSPAYNIWSSGLFSGRSDVLELITQRLASPVVYCCCFWTITKNISFLRVPVYTVQCTRGICDDALYKLMFYLLTYLLTCCQQSARSHSQRSGRVRDSMRVVVYLYSASRSASNALMCVDLSDYNRYLNQIWYRTQIPHYQHAVYIDRRPWAVFTMELL